MVALLESASRSIFVEPELYFNEGQDQYRNREDVLEYNQFGMWVLPITSIDRLASNGGSSTKTWNINLIIYKQTSIDALQAEVRQIVHDAEAIGELYYHHLNDIDYIVLGDVTQTPAYKQFDGSFSGVSLSFSITVADTYEYCPV